MRGGLEKVLQLVGTIKEETFNDPDTLLSAYRQLLVQVEEVSRAHLAAPLSLEEEYVGAVEKALGALRSERQRWTDDATSKEPSAGLYTALGLLEGISSPQPSTAREGALTIIGQTLDHARNPDEMNSSMLLCELAMFKRSMELLWTALGGELGYSKVGGTTVVMKHTVSYLAAVMSQIEELGLSERCQVLEEALDIVSKGEVPVELQEELDGITRAPRSDLGVTEEMTKEEVSEVTEHLVQTGFMESTGKLDTDGKELFKVQPGSAQEAERWIEEQAHEGTQIEFMRCLHSLSSMVQGLEMQLGPVGSNRFLEMGLDQKAEVLERTALDIEQIVSRGQHIRSLHYFLRMASAPREFLEREDMVMLEQVWRHLMGISPIESGLDQAHADALHRVLEQLGRNEKVAQ